MEQIIEPLERESQMDEGKISVISLYSYYNLVFFGNARLAYPSYSKLRYNQERAKINSERKADEVPRYEAKFSVKEKEYKYGTLHPIYNNSKLKFPNNLTF